MLSSFDNYAMASVFCSCELQATSSSTEGAKENVWSSIGSTKIRQLGECPRPAGDNLRATSSSARLPTRKCERRSEKTDNRK